MGSGKPKRGGGTHRQPGLHAYETAGRADQAGQEAEQEADWSLESATLGLAWQGWQPDSGQAGPEADFFTAEAGHLSDILGAHAEGLPCLEPIDKAEEEKQLAELGIQADPGEVRQVPQLQSTRRRGRSGGRPTDPGALDHFSLPTLAQEYKQRKKKVKTGTGKSFP
jgi:hypothetical protein